jgi:hypothetical protein
VAAARTLPGKAGVRAAARQSLPRSQPTGKIAQCTRGLAALAATASKSLRFKTKNVTSEKIPNLIEVIPVVWRLLTSQAFVLFLWWEFCLGVLCQKFMLCVCSLFMLQAYSLYAACI